MERGLIVELSPNEQIALQRIAQGEFKTKDMIERHLVRLKALALIEEVGGDFVLTDLGKRRLADGQHVAEADDQSPKTDERGQRVSEV